MVAAAIIVFRELLEAALIVSIVMAASRGIARRGAWIGTGVAAGVAGAILIAGLASEIAHAAAGIGQELMNALILLLAVMFLGAHVVWMARHSRELASHANKVGEEVRAGTRPLSALAGIAFLAVLREGAETVLFLAGIARGTNESLAAMVGGGLIGAAAGGIVAAALYFGLLHIPLKYFFGTAGAIVVLLAAGMASQAAGFLVQADILPPLSDAVWDTSWLLSEHSVAGTLLHTLIGYVDRPEGIQVVAYAVTLVVLGILTKLVSGNINGRSAAGGVAVIVLLGLLVGLSHHAHAGEKIYSPIVEQGEWEFESRTLFSHDPDPSVSGAQNHVFEIGYGPTSFWATSFLVEVEREPGASAKATHFAWENIFQLTPQGKYWLDVGAYVELEKGLNGDPDEIETKLLLEKQIYQWVATANLIFNKNLNGHEGRGVNFGYDWRVSYMLDPKFELGLEGYGDMGPLDDILPASEQYQTIGPAILGRLPLGRGHIRYDLAYLRGLTTATPESSFQVNLEYEFRF